MIPESWIQRGFCWLCDSPARLVCGLCHTCFTDLPRLAPHNLRPATAPDQCRHWYAAVGYDPPVDRWIHQFKFAQTPALASHFAVLMCAQIMTVYRQERRLLPDLLVPVPTSAKRLRGRGYNQAALLALHLSKTLGIECRQVAAKRSDNRVQHELDKKQREKNMRSVFTVEEVLEYKRVAIVDDIITTGATVSGLAGALNGQGAHEVDAWSFAYTVKRE